MGQITVSQHYVPKFYLKNFSTNSKVWAFDKQKGNCFCSNVDHICTENYFYELKDFDGNYLDVNHIENIFQRQENEWAPLLKKITKVCDTIDGRNSFIASTAEKSALLDFAINMLHRNPAFLQAVSTSFKENGTYDFVDNQLRIGFPDLQTEEFQNYHDSLERFMLYSDNRAAQGEKERFGKYYFYVGFAAGGLITSSFPVYHSKKTDGDKLILPISPDYALIWSENKIGDTANVLRQMSDEIIYDLRKCYYEKDWKDCRFVIADKKEKLNRA